MTEPGKRTGFLKSVDMRASTLRVNIGMDARGEYRTSIQKKFPRRDGGSEKRRKQSSSLGDMSGQGMGDSLPPRSSQKRGRFASPPIKARAQQITLNVPFGGDTGGRFAKVASGSKTKNTICSSLFRARQRGRFVYLHSGRKCGSEIFFATNLGGDRFNKSDLEVKGRGDFSTFLWVQVRGAMCSRCSEGRKTS